MNFKWNSENWNSEILKQNKSIFLLKELVC